MQVKSQSGPCGQVYMNSLDWPGLLDWTTGLIKNNYIYFAKLT